MHRLLRTLRLFSAAMLVLGLLAACTMVSDKVLIANDEATAPLPDAFSFFSYEFGDSGYMRSTDPPASFVRDGNEYIAHDVPDMPGTLTARFVPVGNEVYLMAATISDQPGAIYGFARYADGVLSVALSPDDGTAVALQRAKTGAMPQVRTALAGLTINQKTDEITIGSRAGLDLLAKMYAEGGLPMDRLSVGYVALDPTAPLPSRLIQNGEGWIPVP